MVKTIGAVFDGKVFKPDGPLPIEPNTRVKITIESVELHKGKGSSFLRTARSLKLEGPPDWAANLDAYLYGGE
jgi:predicted DNA-binding antitoxin AbrB/MazE fold protein